MPERIDQPGEQHSPDAQTTRDCKLCAALRHPAQAAQGRKLATHLKTNPLPRQTARA